MSTATALIDAAIETLRGPLRSGDADPDTLETALGPARALGPVPGRLGAVWPISSPAAPTSTTPMPARRSPTWRPSDEATPFPRRPPPGASSSAGPAWAQRPRAAAPATEPTSTTDDTPPPARRWPGPRDYTRCERTTEPGDQRHHRSARADRADAPLARNGARPSPRHRRGAVPTEAERARARQLWARASTSWARTWWPPRCSRGGGPTAVVMARSPGPGDGDDRGRRPPWHRAPERPRHGGRCVEPCRARLGGVPGGGGRALWVCPALRPAGQAASHPPRPPRCLHRCAHHPGVVGAIPGRQHRRGHRRLRSGGDRRRHTRRSARSNASTPSVLTGRRPWWA